ncbi:MAG: glycosyltransferase family 25 protein [Phycisphaerales bacterium]
MTAAPSAPPCPILVINLDSSTSRLESVTRQLHAAGFTFERLPAVDGRLLPEGEVARLCPDNSRHFYSPLSRGEVGCSLSHIRALRTMLDRGLDRCVVFEDDFELRPGFARCLHELLALGDRLPEAVKMYGRRSRGEVIATLPGGDRLVRSNSPPICSTCTLWTDRGARKLLAASSRILRPIDVQVKHWWEMDLDVAWVSPPPVIDCTELMQRSTIGDRRAQGVARLLSQLRYRWGYAAARQWHCLRIGGPARWFRALTRVPGPAHRTP